MRLKRAEYHLLKLIEELSEKDKKQFKEELEEYVQARIEYEAAVRRESGSSCNELFSDCTE